jgi:hypothetical protein
MKVARLRPDQALVFQDEAADILIACGTLAMLLRSALVANADSNSSV